MRTLVLVSVVRQHPHHTRWPVGLYHMFTEEDVSWVDGMEMWHVPIGGPDWARMAALLYRVGRPGEPYMVPREELQPVKRFPITGENLKIVHCEIWS